MSIPVMDTTLDPAQETAIDTAVTDINTNFTMAVNLTPEQRQAVNNIQDERMPFVMKIMGTYVNTNPEFLPPFMPLARYAFLGFRFEILRLTLSISFNNSSNLFWQISFANSVYWCRSSTISILVNGFFRIQRPSFFSNATSCSNHPASGKFMR